MVAKELEGGLRQVGETAWAGNGAAQAREDRGGLACEAGALVAGGTALESARGALESSICSAFLTALEVLRVAMQWGLQLKHGQLCGLANPHHSRTALVSRKAMDIDKWGSFLNGVRSMGSLPLVYARGEINL